MVEEVDQLQALQAQMGAKFDENCDLLAWELGYGEHSSLDDDRVQQIIDRAEELIEKWDEARISDQNLRPSTPMEQLLNEYNDLSDTALNIRDELLTGDDAQATTQEQLRVLGIDETKKPTFEDTLFDYLDGGDATWVEFIAELERLPPEERRARRDDLNSRFLKYVKQLTERASTVMLALDALDRAKPPEKPS
jgi:hypothetical protein